MIEALGSTSLIEVGNNFYLNSNSSGSGPELKYAGAAVVAGQFGGWTPIGVEQTASGYRGCLEDRRRRSIYGLDYRQQRQLHLKYLRRCVGNQFCVASARDQFPPGPERRRGNRDVRQRERSFRW